jgi:hypothetical protein
MCIGGVKHSHGASAIDMTDIPLIRGKANQFLQSPGESLDHIKRNANLLVFLLTNKARAMVLK